MPLPPPSNMNRSAVPSPSGAAPGGMPAAQGQQGGGGDPSKMVGAGSKNPFTSMIVGVNTALLKMQELLGQEKNVPPQALQELQGITKAYQNFLTKLSNLGQSGNAQDQSQSAQAGGQNPGAGQSVPAAGMQMDPNAGARGVPV